MPTFDATKVPLYINKENIDAAIKNLTENINSVDCTGYTGIYKSRPIVELKAQHTVNDFDMQAIAPAIIENEIKSSLALQLARQMIDEDLIEIMTNHDIEKSVTITNARVKIVQE